MNFQKGDMVTCVRGDRWQSDVSECVALPETGGVYTVRTVALGHDGEEYLRLEELVNPPCIYPGGLSEAQFWGCRFRKIRKPDISALRELVVNPPKELA